MSLPGVTYTDHAVGVDGAGTSTVVPANLVAAAAGGRIVWAFTSFEDGGSTVRGGQPGAALDPLGRERVGTNVLL